MAKRVDTPKKDSDMTPALIRMVRDEPMQHGGPTTADVHPEEVSNYSAYGWQVEAER